MIVGIDVSKDKLDIKILPFNKYYQIKNSRSSVKSFMKNRLSKLGKVVHHCFCKFELGLA